MSDEKDLLPCAEKLVFDAKKAAEAAALAIDWQRGAQQLKAYKCSHCGLWHLSSS